MKVRTLIRLLKKADPERDVYWAEYGAQTLQAPGTIAIDFDWDVRIYCHEDDTPLVRILK